MLDSQPFLPAQRTAETLLLIKCIFPLNFIFIILFLNEPISKGDSLMTNGELAAAITHKLKLEEEVWNVSIFPNEALGSSVIAVLSQIMSGKKHMRASLSCFGMGERGVPSLSRWRKVLAVQTFLGAGACEESAAGAWGSRRVWHGCGACTVAITSWGGQLGNETGVWTGSDSKTIPSSFPLSSRFYHLCAWERQSLWKDSSKL